MNLNHSIIICILKRRDEVGTKQKASVITRILDQVGAGRRRRQERGWGREAQRIVPPTVASGAGVLDATVTVCTMRSLSEPNTRPFERIGHAHARTALVPHHAPHHAPALTPRSWHLICDGDRPVPARLRPRKLLPMPPAKPRLSLVLPLHPSLLSPALSCLSAPRRTGQRPSSLARRASVSLLLSSIDSGRHMHMACEKDSRAPIHPYARIPPSHSCAHHASRTSDERKRTPSADYNPETVAANGHATQRGATQPPMPPSTVSPVSRRSPRGPSHCLLVIGMQWCRDANDAKRGCHRHYAGGVVPANTAPSSIRSAIAQAFPTAALYVQLTHFFIGGFGRRSRRRAA